MSLKPEIAAEVKGLAVAIVAALMHIRPGLVDSMKVCASETVDAAEAIVEELDRRGHLDAIGKSFER